MDATGLPMAAAMWFKLILAWFGAAVYAAAFAMPQIRSIIFSLFHYALGATGSIKRINEQICCSTIKTIDK